MAAGNEISARVTIDGAKEAAKELQAVGKEAKKLDGTTVEIEVEADTKKAARSLADVLKDVDKMDGKTATAVLAIKAAEVERTLTEIRADLALVDGTDAEVQVRIDRAAELQGELDQIESKIRDIDGTSVEIDTTPTQDGLRRVGDEADNSRSVLANMVGNSAQDLGALGGAAGGAGVAIGQLAEYATEGNISLDGLTKVAGPMAALGIAIKGVSTYMEGIAAEKAFRADLVKEFADEVRDAKTVSQALLETLKETGDIQFSQGRQGFLNLGRDAASLLPILDQLGIGWEQLAADISDPTAKDRLREVNDELFRQGQQTPEVAAAWRDYAAAVDQYGDSWRTQVAGQGIADELEKQANNALAGSEAATTLAAGLDLVAVAATAAGLAAAEAGDDTSDLGDDMDDTTDATDDLRSATEKLTTKYGALSRAVSDDQAWIDLQNSFADAKEAGVEAWNAVANEAEDAEQKVRDNESANNSLKQSIIEYAQEVANIPPAQLTEIIAMVERGELDAAMATVEALDGSTSTVKVQADMSAFYAALKAALRSNPIVARFEDINYDTGGVVDRRGGIAGEAGVEILDGKWITTGPTYVPPGTRVTSTRRTREILHRHHFPRYASGTGSNPTPFVVQPVTVQVNAAVIGNRFDVQRAVANALRGHQRLNGSRP